MKDKFFIKIAHIVGARPQFIKLAPLCRAINSIHKNTSINSIIIHTGQHYDYLMSKVFFDNLKISEPDFNLEIGSGKHGEQTALMLRRIEEVLIKIEPNIVVVYGDTNSTLAGALAACKLQIPIAHVEAGLRSYNRKMPEEINRLLTDHISSLLFCPTKTAVFNLKKEGFNNILENGELIYTINKNFLLKNCFPLVVNVGDIMYDSVLFNLKIALENSLILKTLRLQTNDNLIPYALCTLHRQENTDDPQKLKNILGVLNEISGKGLKVIFPMHPRTKKILDFINNNLSPHITISNPVSYYDMLVLQKNAKIILTDSGGVQKEAFFVNVPCITLRNETEWVETVESGMNILSGINRERILLAYNKICQDFPLIHNKKPIVNFFGNGNSAEVILKIILGFLEKKTSP